MYIYKRRERLREGREKEWEGRNGTRIAATCRNVPPTHR